MRNMLVGSLFDFSKIYIYRVYCLNKFIIMLFLGLPISIYAQAPSNIKPISRQIASNPNYFLPMTISSRHDINKRCDGYLLKCGVDRILALTEVENIESDGFELAESFVYHKKNQPNIGVVVVSEYVNDDDSISGIRYRVSFQQITDKKGKKYWQFVNLHQQFRCLRGSKAGQWSSSLCV